MLRRPVLRLGVTGLSRAGKTVFITSLVANLINRGRMPALRAAADRATRERSLYYGMVRRGALFSAARSLYRLSKEKEKPDAERKLGYQERDMRRIRARIARSARSFDAQVDMALLQHNLESYAALPHASIAGWHDEEVRLLAERAGYR